MSTREAQRVARFGTTVFSEFSALARAANAVNLGQGFPDFDGPDEIKQAAIDAIRGGVNQYAITTGAAALRKAVAEHAARFYGQKVDPDAEVSVASGATEVIFDAVMALVNPGDDVVVFEPFYDSYVASVEMAGGRCRYVRLKAPTWRFDEAELAAAFTDRTKLVIVNTPHNPTGKCFTRDELELIGRLAAEHDAVILSDEVYEHLVYAPARHLRPATIPSLAPRTLTVSSGGKSFSFTGWKIGWALGPADLVKATQKAHQFVTFATASPFQEAIAKALLLPDSYFTGFEQLYRAKRDFLIEGLKAAGFEPYTPQGTYFVVADAGRHAKADDFETCRWLTREVGVAAIPPSAFYSAEHKAEAKRLVRFAFCKGDATLAEAVQRLKRLA
ncbi:MAG: aminotransferase class I/II-fold pyridoxal phosphate-dependent enzyme [Myxococcaceae bacterium]|nr:aminotransferase class I/II-fold pyridoxal phosphate-dependent enzyme [Myxococcaceae bacterium]